MSKIKATVFIPTYNGEKYLNDVLKMIFAQKTDFEFEVHIIDSGSTDKTLEIIERYRKRHKNLRLDQIPNSEFGHGKTRQQAAEMAYGDFVVYLSHDAVPAHEYWLAEMIAPFGINEKVNAVFGKQDPRPNCFPLMKYDIQKVFSQMGPSYAGISLYYDGDFIKDQATRNFVGFYSDVNSATRKKFVLEKVPYRDVKYAEDQLFGEDVIHAGYIKAYTPRGNVWHSNDVSLSEYKNRMFDETLGLRRGGFPVHRPGIAQLLKGILCNQIRICIDQEYRLKRKVYWLVVNPLYHLQRWRGQRLGVKVELKDSRRINRHSLEARKKT